MNIHALNVFTHPSKQLSRPSPYAKLFRSPVHHIRIRVWDTTTDTRYMVLPYRPPHTEAWSLEALESLITKEAMIGVARLEPLYAGV